MKGEEEEEERGRNQRRIKGLRLSSKRRIKGFKITSIRNNSNAASKDQSVMYVIMKRLVPTSLFFLSPMSLIPMVMLCFYFFYQYITASPPPTLFPYSTNHISIRFIYPPPPPPPPPPSSPPPPPSLPPPPSPPSPPPPSPPPPPPPPPPTVTGEMLKSYYNYDETPSSSSCDYTDGKWVRVKRGPLYNNTTCGVIKQSQNCIANGRPDSEYLYWRWKPSNCHLPRFEPLTFLNLIQNKHIAMIGDSVAKNQFDSLICMLLTFSTPTRLDYYRWHFPSHNASLFFYWSPFLVDGVQRESSKGPNYYNTMHLDHVNEKWAMDIEKWDLVVLSIGHWLSDVPSIYYEGGSVLGCRNCPNMNCTNIDFYGPLRKALRVAINTIIERKVRKGGSHGIDVIVRTFSPSHFEGSWDKGGTCSRTRPRRKAKRIKLDGMNAEIRRIQMEEVESAKEKTKGFRGWFRFEAMDLTKLTLLRFDGHPGAYMKPFPFANGIPEYVQNDCVHWCLPGPIDTWNEIFLEMVKKWILHPRSEQ